MNKLMRIWNGFLDYRSLVKLQKKLTKKLKNKKFNPSYTHLDLMRLQGQIDVLEYLNEGKDLWSINKKEEVVVNQPEVVMTANMRIKGPSED